MLIFVVTPVIQVCQKDNYIKRELDNTIFKSLPLSQYKIQHITDIILTLSAHWLTVAAR